MKICINPGHGGRDPGAVGPSGTKESHVAQDIAYHFECGLSTAVHAAFATRLRDNYVSLQERCDIANREDADLLGSAGDLGGEDEWPYRLIPPRTCT